MKPIILAIETSTNACSVAISAAEKIYEEFIVAPQAHSKLILGMIEGLCQQAGLKLEQIEAIAFGRGPGSFTGVRIAASVVQGLAFGLQKPVIAISSLDALIHQAAQKWGHKVKLIALLDARMEEVYYRLGQEDYLGKAANLQFKTDLDYVAVGTGAIAYKDLLRQRNPRLYIDETILYPTAKAIAELALIEYQKANFLTAEQAIPVYLRNDVVAAAKDKKNPD